MDVIELEFEIQPLPVWRFVLEALTAPELEYGKYDRDRQNGQ
jgi:hypothetical protein